MMTKITFSLICTLLLAACISPKKKRNLSDTKDGWVTKQTYQIKIEAKPPENMVLFARRKEKARRLALETAQTRLLQKLVGPKVLAKCQAEEESEKPPSHMCKNSRNMIDLVSDGFIHDLTYSEDQTCLLTYHVRHPNLKFLHDTMQAQSRGELRSKEKRTTEVKLPNNSNDKEPIKNNSTEIKKEPVKKDDIDDLFRDDIDQVDLNSDKNQKKYC